MADRLRFHLDEHIDPVIAAALRSHGIDVTTTIEAGLLSATDFQQLDFARREQRVLVTHDDDFLRLDHAGESHAGIAFCHQIARSIGEIVRALILMYEALEPNEVADRVEFL